MSDVNLCLGAKPELTDEAVERIHSLLPQLPVEEIEKKLATVEVKKADIKAKKKA